MAGCHGARLLGMTQSAPELCLHCTPFPWQVLLTLGCTDDQNVLNKLRTDQYSYSLQ